MGWDYLIKEAISESPAYVGGINVKVIGVGGGGCSSIHRLNKIGLNSELIAVNTDEVQLRNLDVPKKVIVGKDVTHGRGLGGNMNLGETVARSAMEPLYRLVDGADIVFVLSALGGGTGGGIGPVIAELARETRALVVSIVTMPFKAEGPRRWQNAQAALERFRKVSNTVVVLDNNRLLELAPNIPVEKAFMAMDVLVGDIIKNVVETVNTPSFINIDYSDLTAVMRRGGTSTVLYGEGEYFSAEDAVIDTLNNPLMDVDYRGATGALIHITGGPNMTLRTVYKISEGITANIRDDAEVKIGARIDERYRNKIKVTTILTGVHTPFVAEQNLAEGSMGAETYLPMIL